MRPYRINLTKTIKLLLSWVQVIDAQLTTTRYVGVYAFVPRFPASEQARSQTGSTGHEFLPVFVYLPLKALYGVRLWKTNELLYFLTVRTVQPALHS